MVKCKKVISKLKHCISNFFRFITVLTVVGGVDSVMAEQAPNPRSAVAGRVAPARLDGRTVSRDGGTSDANASRAMTNRSATTNVTGRSSVSPVRAAVNPAVKNVARSATNSRAAGVARSAVAGAKKTARSASNVSNAGLARAASIARATAVFNDISKIGGGYAACRDAYATCMDQFCANANDTYRRCYCSARFTEFRDTEYALDEAKALLMKFEDNNLNAVDKSAAEVDAMYSATVGEAAIKNDTSGAQSILNEIGDLLSGKKKASPVSSGSSSLGVLSFDFSSSASDPFGGDGGAFGASIFDTGTGVDLTSLEGEELYNASQKQCLQAISASCDSKAMLNMASSAYGIMIAQDCNAYEKSVDAKREAVKQTVRQAEKILREARLEEYRAHNSQDVNECIDRVRSAMLADAACGTDYKRCLDYSGAYINQTTGEPIYSPRLFQLQDTITLTGTDGTYDVLGQNTKFNDFLDSKKIYANMALDTCRDLSDTVWSEFKRTALIEIAQAQDEKIESVKNSCVATMAECYDTQSNALKEFDTTTAQMTGAVSAAAARAMCEDKVIACASLYGNTTNCTFDGNGKITAGNTTGDDSKRCGLTALLNLVDTVDDIRVAEGCVTAIENYVTDLCTPTSGEGAYPWNCRNLTQDELEAQIMSRVDLYCVDSNGNKITSKEEIAGITDFTIREDIQRIYDAVTDGVTEQLADKCEELNGVWYDEMPDDNTEREKVYYTTVFGRNAAGDDSTKTEAYGACIANSVRNACLSHNDMGNGVEFATYDVASDKCNFTNAWYEYMCTVVLAGVFQDGLCRWDANNELK